MGGVGHGEAKATQGLEERLALLRQRNTALSRRLEGETGAREAAESKVKEDCLLYLLSPSAPSPPNAITAPPFYFVS